jgi:hypothetical protein
VAAEAQLAKAEADSKKGTVAVVAEKKRRGAEARAAAAEARADSAEQAVSELTTATEQAERAVGELTQALLEATERIEEMKEGGGGGLEDPEVVEFLTKAEAHLLAAEAAAAEAEARANALEESKASLELKLAAAQMGGRGGEEEGAREMAALREMYQSSRAEVNELERRAVVAEGRCLQLAPPQDPAEEGPLSLDLRQQVAELQAARRAEANVAEQKAELAEVKAALAVEKADRLMVRDGGEGFVCLPAGGGHKGWELGVLGDYLLGGPVLLTSAVP